MLAASHRAPISVRALSYLGDGQSTKGLQDARAFSGSKLKFAAAVHREHVTATHCFFDSVGIARARPFLPLLRRPYGVFMHGVESWERLRPEARTAFQNARLVLSNSKHTLSRYEALHGRLSQAHVCTLATAEDIPAARVEPTGVPTALILGRIDDQERYKGHDEIIAAWPHVVRAIPGARLLIVGGGSGVDRVRSLAAASATKDAIEVRGFVPEEGMDRIWAQTHVLAMPSRGEGFGLVYIEAMRRGVPSIASIHDSGREVNAHGETGFCVNLDDSTSLPNALISLLGQADLRRVMAIACQDRWRRLYRATAFEMRFRDLLVAHLLTAGAEQE